MDHPSLSGSDSLEIRCESRAITFADSQGPTVHCPAVQWLLQPASGVMPSGSLLCRAIMTVDEFVRVARVGAVAVLLLIIPLTVHAQPLGTCKDRATRAAVGAAFVMGNFADARLLKSISGAGSTR
jgi:hypothetical protein